MTTRPTGPASDPHVRPSATGLNRRQLLGTGAAAIGAGMLPRAGVAAQTPAGSTAVDGDIIYPPDYQGARATGLSPISDEKATLRVFVAGEASVSSFEDNEFTRWYEDQTNVHIEWQVAPSVDIQASLATTLASGDYPDVVMGFGMSATQMLIYGSGGVFVPLEDLIEEHAPRAREIFETYPNVRPPLMMPDGHLYTMPYVNDCYHCRNADRMWIYQPWLETLGFEMPQNLDEFKEVLIAFRDGDPNGNGEADEVPMMSAIPTGPGSLSMTNFFLNSFLYRGVNHLRVGEDGNLEETLTDPARREAYRWLNGLAQERIITEEHFTMSTDMLRDLANAEEVVLGATPSYYWGSFIDMNDFSLEAKWRGYVPVPTLEGPEGHRTSVWNYFGAAHTTGSYLVSSACPDPALAVRWCDGFYDLEATLRSVHGVIGEDVVWAEEGDIAINGKQALWKQLISWSEIDGTHYWGQRNPNYRSNDYRLGEAVDPDRPTFEKALYEATRDAWFPYAQPEELQPVPFALNDEQAEESSTIQTSINQYVEEMEAQFILGRVDLDEGWDDFVDQLNQLGLPAYVELNRVAYQASQEASS